MKNKIVLTSKSKIKLLVVEEALRNLFVNQDFNIVQFDIEDKGSEPVGEENLILQLQSSIKKAKELETDAVFYVAMEGGVKIVDEEMEEIAFVIVADSLGKQARSQAVSFPIPNEVAMKVKVGISFADAVNEVYATNDIKNNQGFVGLLTDNLIDKRSLYLQPTIIAFSKFVKSNWFWK